MKWRLRLFAGILLWLSLMACSSGPREIQYGSDTCAHCVMTITDPRFAAQLITEKGKVHLFDSVECLAAFKDDSPSAQPRRYVSDFEQPGHFMPLEQAQILKSERLRSPMGLHLAAFSASKDPVELAAQYGGNILTWENVTKLVTNAWQQRVSH